MIGDIMQPTHLLLVLVVALLVLGPKRLPEVARQLGNGIRDFRQAISGESHSSETSGTYIPPHNEPAPQEFHHQTAEDSPPATDEAAKPEGEHAQPEGEHEFAHQPSHGADKPSGRLD